MRRKYTAVLFEDSPKTARILKNLRDYVAYGRINEQLLVRMIELRGQSIDKKKKIDANAIAHALGKKTLTELGVKPFFRLHPPRGGIESKNHFGVGKGVLGNNLEHINNLVERML